MPTDRFTRGDTIQLPSVTVFVTKRDSRLNTFSYWTAYKTTGIKLIEAAISDVNARLESIGRLGGNIVDRTRGRVLPEESTLRPLEHLDSFHIHAHALRHSRIWEWRLILIDRHRRRDCRLLAVKTDATNRKNRRSVLTLPISKSGSDFLEIGRAVNPAFSQPIAAHRSDR